MKHWDEDEEDEDEDDYKSPDISESEHGDDGDDDWFSSDGGGY